MAHIGHYISGVGHAGLIGVVLFGPLFSSDPLPFETVNVSVVSAQDFAVLTERPQPVALPDAPAAPDLPETEPRPDATNPDTPPEQSAIPTPPPLPAPEIEVPAPPEPPARVEEPQTEVPTLVTPEAIETPQAPETADIARQRPSDRVAPTPVAPPPPDAEIAPDVQEAVRPDEIGPPDATLQEPREATAPEEAASEIVTEAEEGPPARSVRPPPRPQRLAVAPAVPEIPTPTAPRETPAPQDTAAAIDQALQEALGGAAPAPAEIPAGPVGPPLTAGEREGLMLAVQDCWIIDPGSPSAEVVVTVAMSLTQEGRVQGDVRQISASGGDARAQEVAFQAARRAVLRCQAGGFPLPPEKYDQWQEVEITFNPESMRIR